MSEWYAKFANFCTALPCDVRAEVRSASRRTPVLDALGQLAPERLVIEIGMKIGENGAWRFHARDPFERLRQMGVTGMFGVAQRVDDPAL